MNPLPHSLARLISAVILLSAGLRSAAANRPAGGASSPHVLFISIDDLNDWISPLSGHPLVKTPNIERLARRGVTFVNAHCQAPLCNPSRTSALVGLRPSTTGIYALQPWFRTVPRYENWVTLPQYFMQHGYQVVTTGKIYHDAYPPEDRRDDGEEFSVWGLHGSFNPRPEQRIATPYTTIPLLDWGPFPERDEDSFDYDVVSYAIEQLEAASGEQPLFLNVGLRHPHLPCYAPPKYFALYPDDDSALPPVLEDDRHDVPEFAWYLHWKLPEPRLQWLREHQEWRPHVRGYLAAISFADAMVGRLLDALERSPIADHTVIVLWSDHGYHLGEKGITGKNTLWERSARVPLIFAGPGVARGRSSTRPVELLDLFPTLIEIAGLPERHDLDGRSLVPLLQNPAAPRAEPAITTHGPNNHAVRSERYRYIAYANGAEELYDLEQDPQEWANLAGHPAMAAVIAAHRRWLPARNAEPAPGSKARLLDRRDGRWYWENEPIEGPVPMDDPLPPRG